MFPTFSSASQLINCTINLMEFSEDILQSIVDFDLFFRLRLGRLNEEMKDSEMGGTGDDTFNDVVRDFSHLACSHPERLQRSQPQHTMSPRNTNNDDHN